MKKLTSSFLEKLEKIYSKEELEIIKEGFNTEKRPVVFRINTNKTTSEKIIDFLNEKDLKIKKIPFLTNGYTLLNGTEKDLWDLKIFRDGHIYMQGITSQIPVELIDLPDFLENFKILDLTAAPGGKTTQLSVKMGNEGQIIANEKNTIRFEKLKFTCKRQDSINVELSKTDANHLKNTFCEKFFDVIIADLPCSAEGRINLAKEKSYKFLEKTGINKKNYKIQQEILKNTVGLLKENGQLIYSTCTIDPKENEGIVHYLLSNFPELELEDISSFFEQEEIKNISKPGIKSFEKLIFRKEIINSYRIFPSEITEGFFIAKFRKKV